MTGSEDEGQTLGKILDQLQPDWNLHINDQHLARLFGFVVGVSESNYLLRANTEAIQRAKDFANEHRCGFIIAAKHIPPEGIFMRAGGAPSPD